MNLLEYEHCQEKKVHGAADFPYITYPCTIPLDFACVPPHWHDEMEIIFVKTGQGLISVDFHTYPVKAGSILFVLPGQVHSICQDGNCVMTYENIIFRTDLLRTTPSTSCNTVYLEPLLQGRMTIPTHFQPENPHYDEIAACLNSADSISARRPKAAPFAILSRLYQLCFLLFSCCCTDSPRRKGSASQELMKRFIQHIEQHYMDKITVRQAAAVLNVSPSYFMKLIRKNLGTTFTAFLNEYRLTMAARLLTVSDESRVVDIAVSTGFDNLSYFNRKFKQRFSMTPKEYRAKSRG